MYRYLVDILVVWELKKDLFRLREFWVCDSFYEDLHVFFLFFDPFSFLFVLNSFRSCGSFWDFLSRIVLVRTLCGFEYHEWFLVIADAFFWLVCERAKCLIKAPFFDIWHFNFHLFNRIVQFCNIIWLNLKLSLPDFGVSISVLHGPGLIYDSLHSGLVCTSV
jgi:hypothetical protein